MLRTVSPSCNFLFILEVCYEVIINVAIKPTPSIGLPQATYNFKEDKITDLVIEGRHDVAIILRMPVVLESVCQMVLTDLYLRSQVYAN